MTQLTQDSDMELLNTAISKYRDFIAGIPGVETFQRKDLIEVIEDYKQRSIDRAIIEARVDELNNVLKETETGDISIWVYKWAKKRKAELEQQLSPTTTEEVK